MSRHGAVCRPLGGSPITDYEYALDGGAWVSASTTSSPFTITGLTNGTSYNVTLRAVNAVGAGTASAAVSGTSTAPTFTLLGTDIDGEAVSDLSGVSVALSADGSIVAIGTPYNGGNGPDAGHVRVYEWS